MLKPLRFIQTISRTNVASSMFNPERLVYRRAHHEKINPRNRIDRFHSAKAAFQAVYARSDNAQCTYFPQPSFANLTHAAFTLFPIPPIL